MSCPYKNLFGRVGEGVHSYRIFNVAIVDTVATIVAAVVIQKFVPQYNVWSILFVLFLLGIILHRLFCVRTTVDKALFP
jgi:uncharacterized membrane protein YcaP (DUF421 family)